MECVGNNKQLEFLGIKEQDEEWRDEGREVGRDGFWGCFYAILKG